MRMGALVLVLGVVAAGGAQAADLSPGAGGGGMNVVPSGRWVVWSEPANLDGVVASSEVISEDGFETETANDFVLNEDIRISRARWWGAYWSVVDCNDIGYATHWNLRFYEDGGCLPSAVVYEQVNVPASETYVSCQSGLYPICKYEAENLSFDPQIYVRYWFGAQASDHGSPPQVGRLASAAVVGCESAFKSEYFGYYDWVPVSDPFGQSFDVSQEFEGGDIPPPDWGACCIGDQGECEIVYTEAECEDLGGQWQGLYVHCQPNPCTVDPVEETTWGQIKHQYR
jgi:hypothetical protein